MRIMNGQMQFECPECGIYVPLGYEHKCPGWVKMAGLQRALTNDTITKAPVKKKNVNKQKEKERVWYMVLRGLTKWSKRAEKLKWIKCDGCSSPDGWYDHTEILSSLLGYCGYFKGLKYDKKN